MVKNDNDDRRQELITAVDRKHPFDVNYNDDRARERCSFCERLVHIVDGVYTCGCD
jgi:hypothetical protein